MYTLWVYECPNSQSAVRRFKRGNVIKMCNGIIFNFYMGLPHVLYYMFNEIYKVALVHKPSGSNNCKLNYFQPKLANPLT